MAFTPTQRRQIFVSLVLPMAGTFALVALVCGGLYLREANFLIGSNILERESLRMHTFSDLIAGDMNSTITDLRQLASGDKLQDYLLSGQQSDLDRAVKRAVFCAKSEPDYDDIRFLDNSGHEVFRVDQDGVVVPKEQLQDKSNRPFFQRTSTLPPDEIYMSAFDLDMEHGQIAQPLRPTIRFGTPVFDEKGRRCGIYVINYDGIALIQDLENRVPQYAQRLRILNDKGYWLKGAQSDKEWGFMLPGREGSTLAKEDPQLWTLIQRDPVGQVPYRGGYFTWHRFVPAESASERNLVLSSDAPYIVVASELSAPEWDGALAGLRQTFVIVAGVLFLLAAVICWFFHARQRVILERDRFFHLTRDLLCIIGFDGKFKRVNTAWENALGFTPEELVGKAFIEFVHPEDRERTLAEAARIARGVDSLNFENRFRCRDGKWRWLGWSSRPLVSEQIIFGSARDLTERKIMEQKLQGLNEALKLRADLLQVANEELESFSYSVSHDLRAPLRHINGFVDLLQKEIDAGSTENINHYMGVIARAAGDMGRLIDDLLAFSRTGRAEMHPTEIDMNAMIDGIISDLVIDCKGREITWRIGRLSPALGDPSLLRLVWANLLDNALKYTRRRPDAVIEIGQLEPGHAERNGHASGDALVYFVHDNGVGFNMEYASKLFGVFQRLHHPRDFEGTGIGLANVQRIIRRHGGQVWAEGRVDHGATFYFSLPVTPYEI